MENVSEEKSPKESKQNEKKNMRHKKQPHHNKKIIKASVLDALDSVHKSLLYKNLQYEDTKTIDDYNKVKSTLRTTQLEGNNKPLHNEEVFTETTNQKKSNKNNTRNKLYSKKSRTTYYTVNKLNKQNSNNFEYDNSSDSNYSSQTDLNKTVPSNFNYFRHNTTNLVNNINIEKRNSLDSGNTNTNLIRRKITIKFSKIKSSDSCSSNESNDISDGTYTIRPISPSHTYHIIDDDDGNVRYVNDKVFDNKRRESIDDDEFHDCYDYINDTYQNQHHNIRPYSYSKSPETPIEEPQHRHYTNVDNKEQEEESSSVYEETNSNEETTTCDRDDESSEYEEDVTDSDIKTKAPLIHIEQEFTQSMEVKSTITINKSKLKEMQKNKKIRQKIIDDNFCNEILDQTFHFVPRSTEKLSCNLTPNAQSDSSVDYNNDSVITYGTLSGKRKHSSKNSGRLMTSRMKKVEKYRQLKQEAREDKLFLRNLSTNSDSSTISNGPKKPPRTFAYQNNKLSSRKSVAGNSDSTIECIDSDFLNRFERLKTTTITPKRDVTIKPSCPTLEDIVNDKHNKTSSSTRVHEIGWVVPKDQLNKSLPAVNQDSSDVEYKAKRNTTSYFKPRSQTFIENEKGYTVQNQIDTAMQRFLVNERQTKCFGHKLDIDTVDGPTKKTPSPQKSLHPLNFEKFAANTRVQSTPRKKESDDVVTNRFLEAERDCDPDAQPMNFIENDSLYKYNYCKNCSARINKNDGRNKRSTFRKNAVRRTISFFEASKKRIQKKANALKSKDKNLSDSEIVYTTPQKLDNTSNLNQNSLLYDDDKNSHKHLGWTPVNMKSCTSCGNSNSLVEEKKYCNQQVASVSERPKKPVRLSLNFNKPPVVPASRNYSFETENKEDKQIKFTKNSNKGNKTALTKLAALKLSPIRKKMNHLDGVGIDRKAVDEPMIKKTESYKSFTDREQNTTAVMGRVLTHIRGIVEEEDNMSKYNTLESTSRMGNITKRLRHISTSSELLDRSVDGVIQIDLHDEPEPLYAEIFPKNRICNNTNNNYIIANNNPNAIYATVNKPARMNNCKNLNKIKSHSLNNIIPPTKLSDSSTTPASIPTKHRLNQTIDSDYFNNHNRYNKNVSNNILLNNSCDSIQNVIHKNSNSNNGLNLNFQDYKFLDIIKKDDDIINLSANRIDDKLLKSVDDKYESSEGNTYKNYNLFKDNYIDSDIESINFPAVTERTKVGLKPFLAATASSSTKSDDELYADNLLIDGIANLTDNKSIELTTKELIEMEAQAAIFNEDFKSTDEEIGHDAADYSHPVYGTYDDNTEDIPEFVLNNVSIMSDQTIASGANKHNNSLGRIKQNSSDVYKTLRNKLRSSFRKSKRIQKKITNFFDDKKDEIVLPKESPKIVESTIKFNLDDYKRNFSNQRGDKLYQSLLPKMDTIKNNDTLTNILNQIKTQTSIHSQLKNALGICRNNQEFACSTELIEAERLLLISNLKEHAGKNELLKMESAGILDKRQKVNNSESGVLTINDLEFKLNEATILDTLFNYFYVCVFTHKNFVKATYAKEKVGDHVYFHNCNIKLSDLVSDYLIRIEIYVLRLKKNGRNANDSKFSLSKDGRSFLMLTPSSSKNSPGKITRRTEFECEFSQFKSQGFVDITTSSFSSTDFSEETITSGSNSNPSIPYYSSPNFQQSVVIVDQISIHTIKDLKEFKLNSIIYNSNLTNSIMLGLCSEIKFKNTEIDGFITLGEIVNDVIYWNRRWGRIEGLILKFWNYPQVNDENDPIVSIDLKNCISPNILLTNRSVCARPRTCTLEVGDKTANKKTQNNLNKVSRKTYFLSTDSQFELRTWMIELDRIVTFLRNWNI